MKFCPLCYNLLMVEQARTNIRLICSGCQYYYPLDRPIRSKVQVNTHKNLEIVEQNQDKKEMQITTQQCAKCDSNRAYVEQRQTRSADEASTLFFTCVSCGHKWAEN